MTPDQARELIGQIGRMNILAISGGRTRLIDGVLVLPVGSGYTVEVEYVRGRDSYTVRRVFTRAGKRFVKGEVEDVYAGEIGEMAYQAHAFRSYDFPKGAAA